MHRKRKATFEEIFAQIATLPAAGRYEALMLLIATLLDVLEPQHIHAIRADLLQRREVDYERESEIIELIDGPLALRELIPQGYYPPASNT